MSSTYSVQEDQGERKPVLTRREFVLAALAGLIALPAMGRALAVVAKFASVPSRSFTGTVMPTEVPAGLERDLTEVPKSITFGEDLVFIWKKNGKVMVYSGVCPHAGCLVAYHEDKKEFECPCHAGVFDLEAKVIAGPPPRGMFEHNVRISMGRVLVGRRKDA